MSQAPYSWQFTGNCPQCGSPIYGRVRRPGQYQGEPITGDAGMERLREWEGVNPEEPEARRTCAGSCPYGKLAKQLTDRVAELNRDK